MFSKLIPQKTLFFDFLDEHVEITLTAAQDFFAKISLGPDTQENATTKEHIKEYEKKADNITQHCVKALYKTFITPIDRDQIHSLISIMDDIMDGVYEAANYLCIYKIQTVTGDFLALAKLLIKSVEQIKIAVNGLRNLEHTEIILKACSEVSQLEHDADIVFSEALGRLFDDEGDPCHIIKWKDLYISLEMAIDRCDDVANIIERILLEND